MNEPKNTKGLLNSAIRETLNANVKVVKVVSNKQLIISVGKREGVNFNDKCEIYEVGDELFHPDTDESLGCYEIPKGTGKITHVMEKMSIVDFIEQNPFLNILDGGDSGFKNPKVGDQVRKLF